MLGPIDDTFQIPANATGWTDNGISYNVPFPVTIWGVQPHMHTKGTNISVSMTDAAGNNTCLIDIPQWAFQWQQMYFYTGPINVPAGTNIKLQCTWTNPTAQSVTFGETTADEMCLAFFYATQ